VEFETRGGSGEEGWKLRREVGVEMRGWKLRREAGVETKGVSGDVCGGGGCGKGLLLPFPLICSYTAGGEQGEY
jgi:hypothetical protein